MSRELIHDGKLDREAAAEALREFLEKIVNAGRFELRVTVSVAQGTAEGDAEVLADLDGKDKEILLARGGEVLKALEHLAFRALNLEPAGAGEVRLGSGVYRAVP